MAAPDAPILKDLAGLIGTIDRDGFRTAVLQTLNHAGKISDYSVFTIADASTAAPEFSYGAGEMGDYQILRNANDLTESRSYAEYIQGLVDDARTRGTVLVRQQPETDRDPELYRVFSRSGVIEKLYTVHLSEGIAHYISYFRRAQDGLFGDEEIARLTDLIPVIDGLIILRHKLLGSRRTARAGLVEDLKARNVHPFALLSPREIDVCDRIVRGLTTEGIALDLGLSQSSVKTLRQRAYNKLEIATQTELFAMLLNMLR